MNGGLKMLILAYEANSALAHKNEIKIVKITHSVSGTSNPAIPSTLIPILLFSTSQVSKSAPTGEYLTTGSFMIRGKKNYLPPSHLILGFGILFKLGEECVENHKNERRVRTLMEDEAVASTASSEQPQEIADNEVNEEEVNNQEEEEEIKSESSQSDDEDNAQ